MLSVVDRNGRPVRTLGAAEVEAMLAAFARPGATAKARTCGAEIVSVRGRHADSVARFVVHLTTQCQEFMDDG